MLTLILTRPCKENYKTCDVITEGPVTVAVAPCWWIKAFLFKLRVTGAVEWILWLRERTET